MRLIRIGLCILYVSAVLILSCIVAISERESRGATRRPFHAIRSFSCLGLRLSGGALPMRGRSGPGRFHRLVVAVGFALASAWLAFIGYVVLTFELPGMD